MSKRREPQPWKQYRAPHGVVSLEIPADWTTEEQPGFGVLCEVGNGACIAVAAFTRQFATLRDFAEAKFRIESYFRACSERSPIHGPGWEGIEQAFEGTSPEDDSPTLCRISCMHGEGLFVSVTLNTSPERYAKSHEPYDRIRSSLRIQPKPWWRFWGH